MPDYIRIASKIRDSIWLITPDGMSLILEIFDRRLSGERLTDEEIAIRLQEVGARDNSGPDLNIQNGVGILPIYGPIFGKANLMTKLSGATSMEAFRSDLQMMVENPQVKSILLDIDSPGGTSDMISEAGGEIFAAREEKPVYAIANSLSGSAAYWLMSQATKAYSSPSGSVGSIGAFTVHEDQSVADANAGRKYTFVSAGKYKTEGNSHLPLTQEGREYRQELIDDLYGEFVDAVAQGRNVTADDVVANYGQGRMLMPKKALEVGMVDGIMEYNELLGNLTAENTSPAQRISVAVPGGNVAATAILHENGDYYFDTDESGRIKLESADLEHSEPGTGPTPQIGSPEQPDPGVGQPVPRKTGNPSDDDPAIGGGWRRDPLPLPSTDPNAPKPNATSTGGTDMTDEEFATLCASLGLTGDATVEKVIATANAAYTESNSLREAVALANEEQRFAEAFPAVWKEHQDLLATNRANNSIAFSESVKCIQRPVNEGFEVTDKALSTLARETIAETHTKFAEGTGTLADFEKAITCITHGGVVDFSEVGSDLTRDLVELDTSTPGGIQNARREFAKKVMDIQASDKLEYSAALEVAAQKFPDLAAAWRTPLPA